jgi:hypothetical protein
MTRHPTQHPLITSHPNHTQPNPTQHYSRAPARRGRGAARDGHQGRGARGRLRDDVPAAAVSSSGG